MATSLPPLPIEVLNSISSYLNSAIDAARAGYWSASEDEDVMTGNLGGTLRTGVHVVETFGNDRKEQWKWSIDYTKFRGRGANATESHLGADGIITMSVQSGSATKFKSILFQSKLNWHTDNNLVGQAMRLSTWREAAIAINYTENKFEAYSIDSILQSRGEKTKAIDGVDLKEALSKYFLECKIGSTTLSYEARTRLLSWVDNKGQKIATRFSIPNRIKIKIQTPDYEEKKEISHSEIHSHRMDSSSEGILKPLLSDREETLQKRKRKISQIYHPDQFYLDTICQEIATKRMQEFNSIFDSHKSE